MSQENKSKFVDFSKVREFMTKENEKVKNGNFKELHWSVKYGVPVTLAVSGFACLLPVIAQGIDSLEPGQTGTPQSASSESAPDLTPQPTDNGQLETHVDSDGDVHIPRVVFNSGNPQLLEDELEKVIAGDVTVDKVEIDLGDPDNADDDKFVYSVLVAAAGNTDVNRFIATANEGAIGGGASQEDLPPVELNLQSVRHVAPVQVELNSDIELTTSEAFVDFGGTVTISAAQSSITVHRGDNGNEYDFAGSATLNEDQVADLETASGSIVSTVENIERDEAKFGESFLAFPGTSEEIIAVCENADELPGDIVINTPEIQAFLNAQGLAPMYVACPVGEDSAQWLKDVDIDGDGFVNVLRAGNLVPVPATLFNPARSGGSDNLLNTDKDFAYYDDGNGGTLVIRRLPEGSPNFVVSAVVNNPSLFREVHEEWVKTGSLVGVPTSDIADGYTVFAGKDDQQVSWNVADGTFGVSYDGESSGEISWSPASLVTPTPEPTAVPRESNPGQLAFELGWEATDLGQLFVREFNGSGQKVLESSEQGIVGYVDTTGEWLSTKGWLDVMLEDDQLAATTAVGNLDTVRLRGVTDGDPMLDSFPITDSVGNILGESNMSFRLFYVDQNGHLQMTIVPLVATVNGQVVYLDNSQELWAQDLQEQIDARADLVVRGKKITVIFANDTNDVNKFLNSFPGPNGNLWISVLRDSVDDFSSPLADLYRTGNGPEFTIPLAPNSSLYQTVPRTIELP